VSQLTEAEILIKRWYQLNKKEIKEIDPEIEGLVTFVISELMKGINNISHCKIEGKQLNRREPKYNELEKC